MVYGVVRCGRRTCGCIKRGEATSVTRGGSMPSIRFPRAIGNLLLFLLSAPFLVSRVSRLNAHYAARTHVCNLLTRQDASPLCRRTTLAGPTTLLGDGDTPSCQRAPEDNRSSVPCTMQRKEKGMRIGFA